MKKLFHLLWLLAAPYLMVSCTDEEEPTPAPFSQLTSTVVYSKYTNDGYLPKDHPTTEMRVYTGDTIRYKFKFETNKGIKDFKVYDNLRGREWPLLVGNSGELTQKDGVWVSEYTLEYLVNSYVVQAKPGETITLTVEAEDNSGTIYKDPGTGKVPEIKLTIAEPYVYQGVRLYNHWGNSRNSLIITDLTAAADIPRQGLQSENIYTFTALLTNKMPPRGWFDNRFEHSFSAGERNGDQQATFVKVPSGAKNWNQPNQIALGMKQQYRPAVSIVENVQEGDVYAFKAHNHYGNPWVIYGLIEVKKIVDDGGDTVSKTGHDEDYMEFDIKYFPGFRY
ncbi:hypothetical protein [Rufibacter hautae]|uniref:DUF5007 domain-containing protein n=1 Tax=Rufibacter hautae TaxID=2595005 RepID=A0A5B6TB23_9BACT|nr:hypothetical protein [Rufibacter hautae]KAA3436171.1 hypothetical protein FOA19_17360 [Rufibacter hautae]